MEPAALTGTSSTHLPNKTVFVVTGFFIYRDRQERLWFATINGVCWYDGTSFRHLEDDGIVGRCVEFLYEDRQGRIWCGGEGTLGYYDGSAFHDLIPLYQQYYQQPPSPQWPNQCRGIAQDPAGHLWFGFDYLIRFDGESFHRYEEEEGFPKPTSATSWGGSYRQGVDWSAAPSRHSHTTMRMVPFSLFR